MAQWLTQENVGWIPSTPHSGIQPTLTPSPEHPSEITSMGTRHACGALHSFP